MGYKFVKAKLVIILVSCLLSACEKIDMRGMFLSYRSVNERFEQSMEWNNTHSYSEIVVPADDYTIFVMSDSHVGGTENMDSFFADAIASGAVAAVMAGDLTTGQEADYRVFEEHLPDPGLLAQFPLVGNHDLYFNGWQHFYSLFGSSSYLFTVRSPVATDLFICLDSGSGTLGSRQLEWLKDLLPDERAEYRRCVIFTHNNLFRFRRTASTSPLVEELQVLMDLFIRHDVNMVITGHDHRKAAGKLGNTSHIILDALVDGNSEAGYMEINITDGNIGYTFINL